MEINARLANSIFANHERANLDMKKQEEDISMKHEYFDDNNNDDNDDCNLFHDDVSIKQESDTEFDDAETFHDASPQRESDNETDEKEYKEPQLETADEIEKQATIDKDSFMKTKLEINKVDLEASKEAELKKTQEVFYEIKEEEDIKDFLYTIIIFLTLMKFVKAIRNLLWISLIELVLLLCQQ